MRRGTRPMALRRRESVRPASEGSNLVFREIVSLLLRVGLGALFLYAGVLKLLDVQGFAVDIANYRAAPSFLVPLMAATLPGIEIVCGVCLLVPRTLRAAAWLTALILAGFTLAVAQALARDINIECGCFGTSDGTHVGMFKILQNLGMLVVAVIATRRPR